MNKITQRDHYNLAKDNYIRAYEKVASITYAIDNLQQQLVKANSILEIETAEWNKYVNMYFGAQHDQLF